MIERRERAQLSLQVMAYMCKCSHVLLENIESFGWVTHPHIASRIAYMYDMSLEEYNSIVPECRRSQIIPDPVDPPKDDGMTLMEVIRGVYE